MKRLKKTKRVGRGWNYRVLNGRYKVAVGGMGGDEVVENGVAKNLVAENCLAGTISNREEEQGKVSS